MMMEALPGPALEVVKTELALHLLVVPLDPPANLRQVNELLAWGLLGKVRQVESRGLALAKGPLAHEPLLVSGRLAGAMAVRGADTQKREATRLRTTGAFSPRDASESTTRKALGQFGDGDGSHTVGSNPLGTTATSEARRFGWRLCWARARRPYDRGTRDPKDIFETALLEILSKLRRVAISCVGDHGPPCEPPLQGTIE